MKSIQSGDAAAQTFSRHLARNLIASLRVAGPKRQDGKAGPLRGVTLQQNTGIARSTLRALKRTDAEHEANPDLRTLGRIADALGVPVAFLLMRPKDWDMLCRAIGNMRDPVTAAGLLIVDDRSVGPEMAERVLMKCGVHPERPPIGATSDPMEQARLDAVNEWRRRTSHVIAALMQPAARDRDSCVMLTALAAALTNQSKPIAPQPLSTPL